MTCAQHICLSCGWIYDDSLGDAKTTIPANTPFSKLPDDWHCPLCSASKDSFEHINSHSISTAARHQGAGIVIIGAGLAGWAVVDALRSLDADIPITVIADDGADRYHKPMLSAAISQGKTAATLIRAAAKDAANTANIRLLTHTHVTAIDVVTKRVHADASLAPIAYNKLVLAIGAHPIIPPVLTGCAYHHVNQLADFSKLQAALNDTPQSVAIIGAGMIGLELAEDLSRAGHTVSILDVQSRPLSTLLPDDDAANAILNALHTLNIRFFGDTQITAINDNATEKLLYLYSQSKGDHTLKVNQLVVATGLLVDDSLAAHAKLDFDARTGIVANANSLQTSNADIYALGDCISIDGMPCRYVAPHRPQAAAIAHHALGIAHSGYQHTPPMIRLKNKAFTLIIQGKIDTTKPWQRLSGAYDLGELIYTQGTSDAPSAKLQLKWSVIT